MSFKYTGFNYKLYLNILIKIFVNRIDAKEGSKVLFDNGVLIDDGNKVQVGKPNLCGTAVEPKIISHLKDDKVIVFKKKKKKRIQGKE